MTTIEPTFVSFDESCQQNLLDLMNCLSPKRWHSLDIACEIGKLWVHNEFISLFEMCQSNIMLTNKYKQIEFNFIMFTISVCRNSDSLRWIFDTKMWNGTNTNMHMNERKGTFWAIVTSHSCYCHHTIRFNWNKPDIISSLVSQMRYQVGSWFTYWAISEIPLDKKWHEFGLLNIEM